MIELCGRSLVMSCEAYLDAGEDMASSHMLAVARRRQRRRGEEESGAAELADIMTPMALQHLAAYDQFAASRAITDFADLSQSPFHQQPCRQGVAPALLRNSCLFSLSRRRLLLPCELMVIQGIPAGSAEEQHYPFDVIEERAWHSTAAVRRLAGNAMHICQVGSVMALIVALTHELTRSTSSRQYQELGRNVLVAAHASEIISEL